MVFCAIHLKNPGGHSPVFALPLLVSAATQAIPAQAKPGGWSIWKEKSDLMYGH